MMTPTAAATIPTATLTSAQERALETVRRNIGLFASSYPDDTTTANVYLPRPATADFPAGANRGWTTGFWPGMLWLAWQISGDDEFSAVGLRQLDDFAERARRNIDLDHHDLGFLYTLAAVTPWRLLGSAEGREAGLTAADHLMTRFLEPAGIVQAWGNLSDPEQRGRTIVDSLMNMPLLYWATEQSGDPRYAAAAARHATQLARHMIRPDNTTFHTFTWDATTGEPLRGTTAQGFADDSCWARGQAWGIYGFALNFRYTGDAELLHASERCADYFLDHLPEDKVAYWDLVFSDESDQPRDSSAAAIAASGLVELAHWLPEGERRTRYLSEAEQILESLATSYTPSPESGSNALILHSVYDWPKNIGVDEGCLWGDYFYLEALARHALPDQRVFW